MKVMGLLKATESTERGDPPTPEMIAQMGAFLEEVAKAGVSLSGEGLLPTSAGKRITLENGEFTVTDGPFTESKELVSGYALFEVKDLDEAVHWTERFLAVLGGGESELRPIFTWDPAAQG